MNTPRPSRRRRVVRTAAFVGCILVASVFSLVFIVGLIRGVPPSTSITEQAIGTALVVGVTLAIAFAVRGRPREARPATPSRVPVVLRRGPREAQAATPSRASSVLGIAFLVLVHALAVLIPVGLVGLFLLVDILSVRGLLGNLRLSDAVETTATIVEQQCDADDPTMCETEVAFSTEDGRTVRAQLTDDPRLRSYAGSADRVEIRYDPQDPSSVTTSTSSTGPGTTFSIVFFYVLLVLLYGGQVFGVVAFIDRARRRRQMRAASVGL